MCLWRLRVSKNVRMIATFVFITVNPFLHPSLLEAAQVVHLTINDKQGVYQLALEVILNARSDDVHYVITDYAHIYRIDPSIVESDIMGRPDASVTRVRTLINDCVLFLCQPILRVEDVREVGDDDIYSVVVPQLSNVRSGAEHWRILPTGDKTRIDYNSTLQPDFFVPPLVGRRIVEKKLQDETLLCFNNIERIARIHKEVLRADDLTGTNSHTEYNLLEHINAN
jgi:hypothetical protein